MATLAHSAATGSDQGPERRIGVLVVDDSAVVRGLTKRWLDEESDIAVVGSASNGAMAVEQVRKLRPDVVVLDIEMPQMDGLTALPEILKAVPGVKVVMSSTLTARNAEISLKALSLGAADYVTKPQASGELQAPGGFRRELVAKIRALGAAKRLRPRGDGRALGSAGEQALVKARPEGGLYGCAPIVMRHNRTARPQVIVIGASTGGPQALNRVLTSLGGLRQPVLIVQHMPPTFTTILAQHLNNLPQIHCAEARDGMPLQDGRVYLAPGDHHMVVQRRDGGFILEVNQDPPENFCRPAVDPMFRSVADAFGGNVLAIVLTGMGHDGLSGGQMIVEHGGTLIAQDEASSVVWGMPGAVATGGLCSAVLPLQDIGPAIARVANGGQL